MENMLGVLCIRLGFIQQGYRRRKSGCIECFSMNTVWSSKLYWLRESRLVGGAFAPFIWTHLISSLEKGKAFCISVYIISTSGEKLRVCVQCSAVQSDLRLLSQHFFFLLRKSQHSLVASFLFLSRYCQLRALKRPLIVLKALGNSVFIFTQFLGEDC
jgi:hypothetical protein